MSVAAWEREAIGERTRDALRFKINSGERVGKVLFGYDLAADGKTLIPNPTERQAIGLMHDLREAGHTLRYIAGMLTERGVATKEGRKRWTHTAVSYILKQKRLQVA